MPVNGLLVLLLRRFSQYTLKKSSSSAASNVPKMELRETLIYKYSVTTCGMSVCVPLEGPLETNLRAS